MVRALAAVNSKASSTLSSEPPTGNHSSAAVRDANSHSSSAPSSDPPTGKHSSAVLRDLVVDGSKSSSASSTAYPWIILAITRNASSPKAKSLGSLPGVKLIEGTLSDPEALFDEAKTGGSVYGVFSAQQGPDNPDGGVKGEIMQGKAFADAAVKAGVKHFVYSGTDFGGVANTNVPQ